MTHFEHEFSPVEVGPRTLRVAERVVSIQQGRIETRNVDAGTPGLIEDFDSVVLACGGEASNELYRALEGRVASLHLIGDALGAAAHLVRSATDVGAGACHLSCNDAPDRRAMLRAGR